jgi:hypothetical protein
MAQTSFTSPSCCTPCSGIQTVQVPGAVGSSGADGADGLDGVNAYTYTSAQFLMPDTADNAPADQVTITVLNTAWMVVGQMLFIQGAGYMVVVAVLNSTSVTLGNPEDSTTGAYAINSALGAAVAAGSKVSPAGLQGTAAAAASPVYHCTDDGKDYVIEVVIQDGIPTMQLVEYP